MYPILSPGIMLLGPPGTSPKTLTIPEVSLSLPIMLRRRVVLPHPLGPSRPYLVIH